MPFPHLCTCVHAIILPFTPFCLQFIQNPGQISRFVHRHWMGTLSSPLHPFMVDHTDVSVVLFCDTTVTLFVLETLTADSQYSVGFCWMN